MRIEKFIDTRRWRRWLVPAVICLIGLSVEVYTLASCRTSHLVAMDAHRVVLNEFGAGARVVRTFMMPSDGLSAVRTLLSATEPSDVVFGRARSEQATPTESALVARNRKIVRGLLGERWKTLTFPPIVESATRTYRLELQLVAVGPETRRDDVARKAPEVGVVASLDRIRV